MIMETGDKAVDLFSPETLQCPYRAYKWLRDTSPVYHIPGTDTWVLTRYEDIVDVLAKPAIFHHGPAQNPDPRGSSQNDEGHPVTVYEEHGEVIQAPLNSDPPNHRQYRNLIDNHFSVRGVERHRGLIEREATTLIDSWIDDGRVEFLHQFAEPLPVAVITEIFGFERERRDELFEWSYAWTLPFTGRLTPEQQDYVADEVGQFRAYIKKTIARKRGQPDDTLVGNLVRAIFRPVGEPERPLSVPEMVSIIEMLFTGGNHTTEHALGQMIMLMVRKPGLEHEVRANRDLVSGVVEETLRLESVVQGMFRNTAEQVVVGRTVIPKGATVHLRFGAANRDERMFPNPDELDPNRANRRRNVTFGLGEHHCPGSPLARLEMIIALNALLDRTCNWRLAPSDNIGVHRPGFIVRGLQELQLEFDRVAEPVTI
jgi:cytochrome P450